MLALLNQRAAQLGRYVLLRLRRRAGEHRACASRQPLRARPDAAVAGHACRGWPGLCRLTCPETNPRPTDWCAKGGIRLLLLAKCQRTRPDRSGRAGHRCQPDFQHLSQTE